MTEVLAFVDQLRDGLDEALGSTSTRALVSMEEPTVEALQKELMPIAQKIDNELTAMLRRRKRANRIDLWHFGLLFSFLGEKVVFRRTDPATGEVLEEKKVSRFEIFQAAGFWQGRDFVEWACERSGVKRETWYNWVYVADVYLLTENGKRCIEDMGMTPNEFIESVSIDKALRAASNVSAGTLEEHHLKILKDPDQGSRVMRHALRSSREEWDEVEEQSERADEQWVQEGDEEPEIVYDPARGTVKLHMIHRGDWQRFSVVDLPVPAIPAIKELQRVMIQAAKREVERWRG